MKTNLSIGIPTYNQGQFLQETIDSILSQTILPDEIVISNNFSDDNTEEILEQYEDNRLFKIIKPSKFIKMCSNWNFTAKNCNTDFFSLISSDDVLESNFVESFMSHRTPDCLFYRGNFNIINEHGKKLGKQSLRSVPYVQSFPNNFLNQFHGPKGAFPSFIISKELYNQVGGYDEKFNFFADWHLLLKISDKTNFCHINKIISNYRVSYREGLNYKRTINGGLEDIIYTLDYISKKINDHNLKRFRFFYKISVRIHMYQSMKLLNESDQSQKKMIQHFIKKMNVNIDKTELVIFIYKYILRTFELILRFVKIN